MFLVAVAVHASSAFAQQLLDLPSLPLSGVGRVQAIVVQGDGKIIIGGAFTYVSEGGADVRVNIARFHSNGMLDASFDFKPTSTVDALAIIGNTLYLGGDFTGLSKTGGATTLRNRLAAIDLPSLTITTFNPNMDGEVFALAASGSTLYAGGAFSFVGGGAIQRIGAAAFDTSQAGAPLTAWDPEPRDSNAPGPAFQGVVRSIAPFGSIVYVGGAFTQIGGLFTAVARDAIAAVDNNTGLATAWDPVASNGGGEAIVNTIVPTASVVYLGGQFSALNGISSPLVQRLAIGAVSAATGVATAWNPGTVAGFGTVRTLLLDGTTMYAGGEFTMMGGAVRNRVAGIDTTVVGITALARASTTATATITSTAGLATGDFITIVGATQPEYNGVKQITVVDATHFNFAIVNTATTPATGTITFAKNSNATAFNPNVDDDVQTMALASPATTILLGGSYLKANGVANPSFGGFSKTTGATTIAGYVYDVAAVRSLVRQPDGKTIVAGDFFTLNAGVFYRGLLRLNANGTLDTSWNPVVQGQVLSAALGPIVSPATAPTTVLVGGSFTTIGATAIKRLAAVDLTTGAATAFNANVNQPVNVVVLDGLIAYIGGSFTQVGGLTRNYAAAVDAVTGALQTWNPGGSGADDFVETLAVDASNVYLGGQFFSMGGLSRLHVAKVSKGSGGVVDAWNPGTNETVFGLTVSGSTVYISGNFTGLGGTNGTTSRNFIGAVNATTGAVLGFNPDPDFIVLKTVVPASPANTVYLVGGFVAVGGVGTGTAVAVNATTGALLPWFTDVSDAAYDLVPDATGAMVGGVFVDVGGVTRFGLAAFTAAGLPDPPTNVLASPLNASASVLFTAPANNGGFGLTGYTVTSIPAGGVDSNAGSLATTHVITGLTNGVAYTFTVTASNINGPSVASAASNSVTPGASVAPTLSSALSRKVHGGTVTYDLPLNGVSTNPTTEPRGGAHLIVFTFNKPVTAGNASVTEGVATAGAATFSGNEMRVPLTAVNNQQYVTVSVSSVSAADGGTGGTGSIRIGYLLGDVNQSRAVSLADLGLVNAQVAQFVTVANYLRDVNISNTMSLADKGIVNGQVTKGLPAP